MECNGLIKYFGLIDARVSASDKELPVRRVSIIGLKITSVSKKLGQSAVIITTIVLTQHRNMKIWKIHQCRDVVRFEKPGVQQ